MSFRIGLVGLCTSHPSAWVPIIREMVKEGIADAEVVCAWDSGETRPAGYAKEFCKELNIPCAVENLEDMIPMVDGVIVHTTNWDKHLEQAEPFVLAGKRVYVDKPIVGNMKDAAKFLDWMKQGYPVTGGSVLRFSREVRKFFALPESERGKVWSAYASVGVDEFNYGIHAYALLSQLCGDGIRSVRYVGCSNQKQIIINYQSGCCGMLTIGRNVWLPFHATATTDKNVFQIPVKAAEVYAGMLETVLPYFTGKTEEKPLSMEHILDPELAAIAAKESWLHNGAEIFIDDLGLNSASYDGTQFAIEYRRARMQAANK